MRHAGLPPDHLELEITESVVMEDPDRALRVIQPLREAGVRLAIDDFGCGHSSLAALSKLPFDVIKIDQQFVRALERGDPQAAAIVEMILALARTLDMEVVAEGVERREDMDFMAARGCHWVQGFLFGAAVLGAGIRRNAAPPGRRRHRWPKTRLDRGAAAPPHLTHERTSKTGTARRSCACARAARSCIAGDGQVSAGPTILKGNARKVRPLGGGAVIAGFAGATADAFALFERLEQKLERFPSQLARACVELAKDWRTDRALRRLDAMLIVADAKETFLITGVGRCARSRASRWSQSAPAAISRSRRRARFTTISMTPKPSRARPWPSPRTFASIPTAI